MPCPMNERFHQDANVLACVSFMLRGHHVIDHNFVAAYILHLFPTEERKRYANSRSIDSAGCYVNIHFMYCTIIRKFTLH